MLLVDADMELVALEGFGELTAPGYRMLQRAGGIDYWNTRLIRRDVGARYRGVTHEYLETDLPVVNLEGPYFIDHADGANRPGKFERDIALLEKAVAIDPGDARSWFYLAQSRRDAGHLEDAAADYLQRITLGGWEEEVFYSKLAASRCLRLLGR